MEFNELNRDRLIHLKQALDVSYGEPCDVDMLIGDNEIAGQYKDAMFSGEDFA